MTPVPPTVIGLRMESERRISRTVYEYTFVVQVRNDSPFNRSGVVLSATSGMAATAIVQGDLQFPSLAAGVTADATNRLVLRHDRAVQFDASKIRWTDRTPVINGKVMDGYIRGATIYWDCNANRRFDPNEVSTVSGPSGAYTIDPVPANGCHLYAQVGPNAVDEDHLGQTVGSAYQLAAVPAGFQLITPYTTLVHGMLNQEPGLSVALADDRLQKSIGFNCGSLLYDYIGNPNAVIACDTAIKTAAKLYREVLQQQPASMPYDVVVERALERMRQLAANPGHAAALGLGLVPYVYRVTDYALLLRSLDPTLQPKLSNRLLTITAGSQRSSEEVLRAFGAYVRSRGSVAYGAISLHQATDAELLAQMHMLRKAAERDPALANKTQIAAALATRAQMLASLKDLFDGRIEDETGYLNLLTNDPAVTARFALTTTTAVLSMFVDGVQVAYGDPTYLKSIVKRDGGAKKVAEALEKMQTRLTSFKEKSSVALALKLWHEYATDPAKETQAQFEAAMVQSIDAALQLGKAWTNADKNGQGPIFALASLFNDGFADRNERFRLLVDLGVFFKEVFALGLEGTPIGSRLIAGIDMLLQGFEVYFAGQDLVAAAGAVQDKRVQEATLAYRDEVAKAMRSYYVDFIRAFDGNYRVVDTDAEDFVDKLTVANSSESTVSVTAEGSFRMSYLPTLGGQACTTTSALANVMVHLCPTAAGAALFDLKSMGGGTLPGAASWVDSATRPRLTPDTGITANQCYQAGSLALASCTSAAALALSDQQDGMVGLDARASSNGGADGHLGFSYSELPGYARSDCVVDNVTGLTWEAKTATGLRAASKTFTNAGNGLASDASGYIAQVNAAALCGFTDWRLPTAVELQGLMNYSIPALSMHIDSTWFDPFVGSLTPGFMYWSSTPLAGDAGQAWRGNFDAGGIGPTPRGQSLHVRLVRGTAPVANSPTRYTYSADGSEVTDTHTGLVWRRCTEGLTWNGSTCVGSPRVLSHEAAFVYANTQTGWRLPNAKELTTIVDRTRVLPASDPVVFPGTFRSWYWTSTPFIGDTRAFYVDFDQGYTNIVDRGGASLPLRLVRDR